MSKLSKIVFVIFNLTAWFGIVSAQKLVEIEQNFSQISIGKQVSYFLDSKKEVSFSDIKSGKFDSLFVKSDTEIPFFDYQNSTIWLKLTVKNTGDEVLYPFLLIDYPLLYKVRVYEPLPDGTTAEYISGDGFKFSERTIHKPSNLFEFHLNPNEEKQILCAVVSDGDVVTLPMFLLSQKKIIEKNSDTQTSVGIYYGILALIIIVNLFYFINLRDKSYLIYILYILMMGMYQFAREGLAFKMFWGNFPYFANAAVGLFSMLAVSSFIYLMINTIQTRTHFPRMHKFLAGIAIIIVFSQIPLFVPAYYRFMIFFGNFIAGIGLILSIITVILAFRKRLFFAKYFSFALIFLIGGSVMMIMKNNGAGGIFQFEHGLKIGVGLEILILAYGLTVKFRDMLAESQKQAIEHLQEINRMRETENEKLEKLVNQRTQEINNQKEELRAQADNLQKINFKLSEQNEEINQQKEELLTQRNEIENQKNILEFQQKELTDSIHYAERIQTAVLKSDSDSEQNTNFEHFVIFRPKEIVSGDFYKISQLDSKAIFAVADCTGHGVPGGYMSMLGIALLNEIVANANVTNPAIALNILREHVKETLHQQDDLLSQKDGMDIALCVYDTDSRQLDFAAAHHSAYLLRHQDNYAEIIELKGDKMPIGYMRKEKPFGYQTVTIEKSDILYLFSDGICDQYNEAGNEKFKSKRLKALVQECAFKPLVEQKQLIETIFEMWKGASQQVDDVLFLGIRFK